MSSELDPIVIITGPHKVGKTRNAKVLAAIFGCHTIVDPWDGKSKLLPGTLALTNKPFAGQAPVPIQSDPAGEVRDAA